MNCDRCGAWNYDDAGFCGSCGKALRKVPDEAAYSRIPLEVPVMCPKCGQKNVRTDSLCKSCGNPLEEVKRTIIANMDAQARQPAPQVMCAFCGGGNQLGQRYCSRCGRGLVKSEYTADPMVIAYLRDIKLYISYAIAMLVVMAVGGFIWFLAWLGRQ